MLVDGSFKFIFDKTLKRKKNRFFICSPCTIYLFPPSCLHYKVSRLDESSLKAPRSSRSSIFISEMDRGQNNPTPTTCTIVIHYQLFRHFFSFQCFHSFSPSRTISPWQSKRMFPRARMPQRTSLIGAKWPMQMTSFSIAPTFGSTRSSWNWFHVLCWRWSQVFSFESSTRPKKGRLASRMAEVTHRPQTIEGLARCLHRRQPNMIHMDQLDYPMATVGVLPRAHQRLRPVESEALIGPPDFWLLF